MRAETPASPRERGAIRMGRSRLLGAVALSAALSAAGCTDNDACKGHSETCLSLTLYGSDGVTRADQLQVLLMRKVQPVLPMMTLDSPQDLPFKVAVLWPDGPATLSVRAMLGGQIAGVSPEFALDLRNGQHLQRKLTLYPPLPGTADVDLGSSRPDMATPSADLATTSPDLAEVPDLSEVQDLPEVPPPPDLTMPPPPDLALPPPPDL